MKTKVIQLGYIAVVLLLLLSGCKTVKGGGWIIGRAEDGTENGKATFGINLNCKNSKFYGGFTYQDHGRMYEMADGKKHHLSLIAWLDPNCLPPDMVCDDQFFADQSVENHTQYNFIYRARPDKSGAEGWGEIHFWDKNHSGVPDENDRLGIIIYDGPYGGYTNEGDLRGGNLTIFDK